MSEIEQVEGKPRRAGTVEEIRALPADTEAVLVAELDDHKAEGLRRLRCLRALYQDGRSQLTDAGLAVLAEIKSLEAIDLEWSERITDQGVAKLFDLPHLRWIDLGGCPQVSEEAVADLQRLRPEVEIER